MKRPPSPRAASWLPLYDFSRDPLDAPLRYHERYGDLFEFRILHLRMYAARDQAFLAQVLLKSQHLFHKDWITRSLRKLLGDGLLTSEGERWRRQRRLIQPTFQPVRLEHFVAPIARICQDFAERWRRLGRINLGDELSSLTLRITLALLFGDHATDTEGVARSMAAVMNYFRGIQGTGVPFPDWLPTPNNLAFAAAKRDLNQLLNEVLKRRLTDPKPRATPDLLDALLAAADAGVLDEQAVHDECLTLILAGHETTASALTLGLCELARRPDIVSQLRAEARTLPEAASHAEGKQEPEFTAEHYTSLSFTRSVVKELLRLYPPVWSIGREAIEDCELEGVWVPRGTQIGVFTWAIQRSECFFEAPLEFRPERWTPELERNLPRYAYLPFGAGTRICIGNHLAMMEATLALATLLRGAEFQIPGGFPELLPSLTLRPRRPVFAEVVAV